MLMSRPIADRREKSDREAAQRSDRHGVRPRPTPARRRCCCASKSRGPLPNIDRVARQALKGSSFERWLEQSGTGDQRQRGASSPRSRWRVMLAASGDDVRRKTVVGALLAFRARALHRADDPPAEARGAALQVRGDFPEALDLLSRGIRAGHAFSAGMKMVADELGEPGRPGVPEGVRRAELRPAAQGIAEQPVPCACPCWTCDSSRRPCSSSARRAATSLRFSTTSRPSCASASRFAARCACTPRTDGSPGYVLMALPAFLALALSFINPEHMNLLFEERMGQMMIVASHRHAGDRVHLDQASHQNRGVAVSMLLPLLAFVFGSLLVTAVTYALTAQAGRTSTTACATSSAAAARPRPDAGRIGTSRSSRS